MSMNHDASRGNEVDCRLCIEISDFETSLFARTYPLVSQPITSLDTCNLRVLIPIGPFCEGHLLVATKMHESSFGHVPGDVLTELVGLLDKLTSLVEARYGRTIVFEHGPLSSVRPGGACLEHAHVNILPIPESFRLA